VLLAELHERAELSAVLSFRVNCLPRVAGSAVGNDLSFQVSGEADFLLLGERQRVRNGRPRDTSRTSPAW